MGLRERNAERTRAAVMAVAADLFVTHGYEATTMENVARTAEIGSSTLYRYFPTKDSLLLAMFGQPGVMAEALRARAESEAIGVALGHAALAMVTHSRSESIYSDLFQLALRESPTARAVISDWFASERDLLQAALAERLGRPEGDLAVMGAVRLVELVLEVATGSEDAGDTPDAIADAVCSVLERLAARPLIVPASPRAKSHGEA